MADQSSGSKTIIILVAGCVTATVFCIVSIACLGIVFALYVDDSDNGKKTEKTTKETTKYTTEETTVVTDGFIEGSYSYPSDFIPTNLRACAMATEGSASEFCATEQIISDKYENGVGFIIQVPAGTYNVYVEDPNIPGYVGLYSEYVECGMYTWCESHEQLDVIVYAGQTTSGINPWDWYSP